MTEILVARSAWTVIARELDRVAPREGVVLPLVALTSRAAPCAPIELTDVTSVVLAEAHPVPAHLQHNTMVNVAALPTTDAWAAQVVLAAVRQQPRLRAAAYLHSHPFALGDTWPSRGDVVGHMHPLLERNADTGLHASFSFIACAARGGGWNLPCFAMDRRQRVCELGTTRIVDDAHPLVRRARGTRGPRGVLRRWRRSLYRRGLSSQLDELFDGWWRVRIPLRTGTAQASRVMVVLFPIDFPADAPRYHLVDLERNEVRPLDLKFSPDAAEVCG